MKLNVYRILDIKKNNKKYIELENDKRFMILSSIGHLLGASVMTGLGAFLVKLAINEYKQTGMVSSLLFEPAVLAALGLAVYESIMDIRDIKNINLEQKYIIEEELNNKSKQLKYYDTIEI